MDALVQFFQSSESSSNGEYAAILSMDCTFSLLPDAPGEVAVVMTALIQHLELDSEVILSILCHQIIHPGDPMKDGDRAIRERPHGLVVAFLAEDAREPLLAQLRSQDDSDAARSGRDTGRHAARGDARSVIVLSKLSLRTSLGFPGSVQIRPQGRSKDHEGHHRLPPPPFDSNNTQRLRLCPPQSTAR